VGQYERYQRDSEVLASIGRVLEAQPNQASVRLPRDLADAAVAAWQRDEQEPLAAPETPWQRAVRMHAATLAMIGLKIEQGVTQVDEGVLVAIDAETIHEAIAASHRP